MADHLLSDADERAHRPGRDPAWEESWYFDFVDAGAGIAAYARLTLRPADRKGQGGGAWWWAAVVGPDLPFVLVREHDIDPPRAGTFEIRASGLWAEPVCETPFEHWSLGLEAFGVAFDDPTEAYGRERGDVVGLGFDLEWEGEPADTHSEAGRYSQPCAVSGEVLVGAQKFDVTGTGTREHAWGVRDWWSGPARAWMGGRFVAEGDLPLDGRGLLAGAELHAPLQVPARDGRLSRLARGVCQGVWAERLQPASSATG